MNCGFCGRFTIDACSLDDVQHAAQSAPGFRIQIPRRSLLDADEDVFRQQAVGDRRLGNRGNTQTTSTLIRYKADEERNRA
jgi:hypothetical protein